MHIETLDWCPMILQTYMVSFINIDTYLKSSKHAKLVRYMYIFGFQKSENYYAPVVKSKTLMLVAFDKHLCLFHRFLPTHFPAHSPIHGHSCSRHQAKFGQTITNCCQSGFLHFDFFQKLNNTHSGQLFFKKTYLNIFCRFPLFFIKLYTLIF